MSTKPKKVFDYFVLVHQPQHPRAVSEGYVAEHYLVAEKELGRPLTPDEEVRHKNGNTQDNRPSNLEIISYNKDYNARSLAENFGEKRVSTKTFMPCKFQRPCWKTIRAPLARENKIFLSYICSFQSEGDIYKCSRFWSFIDQEMKENVDVEK